MAEPRDLDDELWARWVLEAVVPAPEPASERPAAVRRLARRRRLRPAIAGAGALTLAAAAVVVASVTGTDHRRADHGSVDVPSTSACSATSETEESGSGPIRPGVVAVSVCAVVGRYVDSTIDPPHDALTTGLDSFLRPFEATPSPRPSGGGGAVTSTCAGIGGTSYRLVFSYPDGTTENRVFDTGGCGVGGGVPLERFVRSLSRQRSRATPPGTTAPVTCRFPGTRLGNRLPVITDLSHLASARICVRYVFHSRLDADRAVTPTQLALLEADVDHGSSQALTCQDRPSGPGMDVTLQATDQWNDHVYVQLDSCLIENDGGDGVALSAPSRAIVDGYVSEIRSAEPPGLTDPP